MMMDEVLLETLEIRPLDREAMEAARAQQLQLTKPPGSLGRLEDLSVQLAGIHGFPLPELSEKAMVVMAGDHGVALQGVSAYPAEVTPQMVLNFLQGGAAINVLARQLGAHVLVVDMGVNHDFGEIEGLVNRKVAMGTANLAEGPAMTSAQALQAVEAGIEIVEGLTSQGVRLVGTGDMGIGNTTASAAIAATLTGSPAELVVGRGTGVDDEGLARKIRTVKRALQVNQPDPEDALDVLAKVGGFEIAGLVGVVLGAAALGIPVVIDGFITGAAALVAGRLAPSAIPYMIASHQSVEIGHKVIHEALGLQPLFDLSLRLGEGTGAALAMHIVEGAARILGEMATFESAGVSDKS